MQLLLFKMSTKNTILNISLDNNKPIDTFFQAQYTLSYRVLPQILFTNLLFLTSPENCNNFISEPDFEIYENLRKISQHPVYFRTKELTT